VRLLQQIADQSSGRLLDLRAGETTKLFDRTGVEPSEARLPLWRSILLWALVVMLLDVGTRRVAWDRWLSREYGRSVKRETAEATRDRGAQSTRLTGRLRGRVEQIETIAAETTRERPMPAALSQEDAQRIVREQAERRKAERQRRAAERAASRPADSQTTGAGPGAPPPKPAEAEPETPAEGLFAAKARARKRMQDGDGS
jgi:hypothetical protein